MAGGHEDARAGVDGVHARLHEAQMGHGGRIEAAAHDSDPIGHKRYLPYDLLTLIEKMARKKDLESGNDKHRILLPADIALIIRQVPSFLP